MDRLSALAPPLPAVIHNTPDRMALGLTFRRILAAPMSPGSHGAVESGFSSFAIDVIRLVEKSGR
jgi:hypothetical protein